MNCYFCSNELHLPTKTGSGGLLCDHCAQTHHLYKVQNFISNGNLAFVSIWPDPPKFVTIPNIALKIPSRMELIGRHYCIRLDLIDNTTDILDSNDMLSYKKGIILQLPGFPITPSNARNKLKLCLLFL